MGFEREYPFGWTEWTEGFLDPTTRRFGPPPVNRSHRMLTEVHDVQLRRFFLGNCTGRRLWFVDASRSCDLDVSRCLSEESAWLRGFVWTLPDFFERQRPVHEAVPQVHQPSPFHWLLFSECASRRPKLFPIPNRFGSPRGRSMHLLRPSLAGSLLSPGGCCGGASLSE